MMEEDQVFEIEFQSLDPATLILNILAMCSPEWDAEEVMTLYHSIIAEYEEPPTATLKAIQGGKETH